ncbi:MAG: dephospho-CoA kinase, partial [Eubacterium sp.]|nr:dephospho-CoA kinase [Eubacterium sp.]
MDTMNISITGTLGSGKSSVCKLLKEKGYDIISNGVLFREIAEEKGVSVVELNEIAKTDK